MTVTDITTDTTTRVTSPTFAELFWQSGLGQRELCRRAAFKGFALNQQTVQRWITSPGQLYAEGDTIEALAAGLNVSYNDVLHAMSVSIGRPRQWHG